MNIIILTQALNTNYGGLLQAYALQKVLKQQGHKVVTDERLYKSSYVKRIIAPWFRLFKKYVFGKKKTIVFPEYINKQISVNTKKFVKNNVETIDFFDRKGKPFKQHQNKFDAIIVGSDQVWRPSYSNLQLYFLGFEYSESVKRISYAASFGLDTLDEFTTNLKSSCSALAQRFNAISVREDSGVTLCKDHFNVEAEHVLDPTLLLDKEDYLQLIDKSEINSSDIIMCYVLDKTKEKQEIVSVVQKKLDLPLLHVMPEKQIGVDEIDNIEKFVYPSVSKWIAGFRDAKFVVTDSFHGTVFSIIFNKPFIVIGNKKRGMARFSSLLKIFGLENRLVFNKNDLFDQIYQDIDYKAINKIRNSWIDKSLKFLKSNLDSK